ncbi:MAG: ribbon-helix-helix domain-containing protein [Candidatus Hydrothermarchaeales archaeon]
MRVKINISITDETHEILMKYARELGITKTEYVKKALLDKLEDRRSAEQV